MIQAPGHTPLDPKALPTEEVERRRVALELKEQAHAAFRGEQPLVASLCISDAVMLYPNDRDFLDVFDELTFASPDPLALFPVATGAVHVATAAGRARVLMIQKRLPEAFDLLGRVLEVAPDLEYLDWMRRWLQPHVIPTLGLESIMKAVVTPTLRMAIAVPVPPATDDPRLPNLRSAKEIFAALIPHFEGEKALYLGASLINRRLGDHEATLRAAEVGVQRFPEDWGLRTAFMNALRDAHRPDEALQQARKAIEIDPKDFSPLHDAAHGYLAAGRPDQAANLFQELVQRDPTYPTASACMHYARFKAFASEEDRRALLLQRERNYWDDDVVRMANEVDPPAWFLTSLPGPADAAANYGRALVGELTHVMRCCGQGANISLTIRSRYPESPSAFLAFDFAMRSIGAGSATMNVEIENIQNPDPRADKGRVMLPVLSYQQGVVRPIHAYGDPHAQHAVGSVAFQLFRREVWDAHARHIAQQAGPQAANAFVSVFTNPPPAPPDFDGITWMYRCQIACAVILSHMGPWEQGPGRAALYSLVSGPSDWLSIAGIVAFGWRSFDSPQLRSEVDGVFKWLRTMVSEEGFTPWEGALAETWLALGGHDASTQQELEAWVNEYNDTVTEKNSVQPFRRYGGLTLDEYARFSVERDRIQGGLGYGMGAAMQAAFNPSPQLVAHCQKFGVRPNAPFVAEWQEALNASPALMDQFLQAKRDYEFEIMGVSQGEKAALDNILEGNMDMHLRMAQAQEAQRVVADGNAGDPDPVVFPGQRVAKLSDYVAILKGMQQGDMMGALARYGLDMMSYGQVATAWGAKMAADPILTDKFHRMMQG